MLQPLPLFLSLTLIGVHTLFISFFSCLGADAISLSGSLVPLSTSQTHLENKTKRVEKEVIGAVGLGHTAIGNVIRLERFLAWHPKKGERERH